MPERSRASNWRRVSRNYPCPICHETHWCPVTADGALAKCMRVAEGAFKSGEQKEDGARYHLHRLAGAARNGTAPPPGRQSPEPSGPALTCCTAPTPPC